MGIASLLSMGHQQSRGAVGFYLGFKLASALEEKSAGPDELRMALPLDAVNPILETLVQKHIGDDRKKADLLLVSAARHASGEVAVGFAPVEIKNHAAKDVEHEFPEKSQGVKEALEQLSTSEKLIAALTELLKNRPRAALVNSTMAAVVETGAILSRGVGEKVMLQGDVLSAVASGSCSYFQAPSALLWFERHGVSKRKKPFSVRGTESSRRLKLFIDPAKVDFTDHDPDAPVGQFLDFFSNLHELESVPKGTTETQHVSTEDGGSDDTSQVSDIEEPLDDTGTVMTEIEQTGRGDNPSVEVISAESNLRQMDQSVLRSMYEKVIATLDGFKIKVSEPDDVDPIVEGPASLVFRVRPEIGVRPKDIEREVDSLKLALNLQKHHLIKVDIDSGCVELTVPKADDQRTFINTSQLWAAWKRPTDGLEVPLGIDQLGNVVSLNFSSDECPHLLIGGTTGSGKSEALNTILWGMTRYYEPQDLRLMLIDPKGTELQDFEDSKWVQSEIGLDAADAIEILDGSVTEMDRRYAQFREAGVRGLRAFNAVADEPLPWWVIVLDEYADLTSDGDDKTEIEQRVKRLSQNKSGWYSCNHRHAKAEC